MKETYQDERAIEDRRLNDVKAKLSHLVADVDLLIVPRYTVANATLGGGVPAAFTRWTGSRSRWSRSS